jgi:hypothetical protein
MYSLISSVDLVGVSKTIKQIARAKTPAIHFLKNSRMYFSYQIYM